MNYEELLEKARETYESEDTPHVVKAWLLANIIYPTDESEDERIRKAIIAYISHGQHCGVSNADMITWLEKQDDVNEISAEWSEKDEQMILSIEQIMNCASLLNLVPEKIDNIKSWLKSLKPHKQWTPNAAQLIVIKDLIEDKNTSNVNKVILQGMLREINAAYLQGICDAKHAIEKQGEQPTDKVEPKFKVRDWIISNNKKSIYQVIEVKRCIYVIRDNVDNHEYHIGIEECEKSGRLWDIGQDAKDGDVLVNSKGQPFIFSGKYDDMHFDSPIAYCGVNCQNKFKIGNGTHWTSKNGVAPATKEQRDQLEKAITEAGYLWDSEKKELKKIEPKTLDADKVIEWMDEHVPTKFEDMQNYVNQFKKDFEI